MQTISIGRHRPRKDSQSTVYPYKRFIERPLIVQEMQLVHPRWSD
jgi:hypothetical protein